MATSIGETRACLRFYGELNCFVAPALRQRAVEQHCPRDATVKHVVEALGVPHTEVALILVNGCPVDFSYRLQHRDRVSVYPQFASLAPGAQAEALLSEGRPDFVADAHLGRLARDLRMLGFDVLYCNTFSDDEIVRIAVQEQRIVLTRDRDLLMRRQIAYGCYVHALAADAQLSEVMRRYRLADRANPLSRCLDCNGLLRDVPEHEVLAQLPARSRACHSEFRRCLGCGHVYWEGSHVARMRRRIALLLQEAAHRSGEA